MTTNTINSLSMQDKLDQFVQETDAAIDDISSQYLSLVVDDFDDRQTIAAVTDAHKKVKNIRIRVEKTRKSLKADALAWGRTVDEQAKRLTAALTPVEEHLKGERDKVEAEKERIREEKRRAAQEKLQKRIDALAAVNGDVSDIALLQEMTEAKFSETLDQATADHEKAQAEATEREAALEVQRQLSEFGQAPPLPEILELSHADREELISTARAEFEKSEKERLEREAEEERQRQELEEQNRRQQEEIEQLRREKEEREQAERDRFEAEETAKREAEEAEQARIQAKADADAEAARLKREAELKPIREQLQTLAHAVADFEIPASLEAYQLDIRGVLEEAADKIGDLVD